MKEERTALILGSTGLTGKALTELIRKNKNYSRIILPVRRKDGRPDEKVAEVEIDYDHIDASSDLFEVDDIFCCLGTTMKKAGSKEAFRKVDYQYPLEAAQLGKEKGVSRFFVISALGVDPSSKIFYNRVKGEVERDLGKLSFAALHIFRPSLLTGKREEKRFSENAGIFLFKAFSFLLAGPLAKYRAIKAETVARAIALAAEGDEEGIVIHESLDMQKQVDRIWNK